MAEHPPVLALVPCKPAQEKRPPPVPLVASKMALYGLGDIPGLSLREDVAQ